MHESEKNVKATIMDAPAIQRALTRIAHEIVEHNRGVENIALVGVRRRGLPLAERIASRIERIEGVRPPVGEVDIAFYRDDVACKNKQPVLNATGVDFDVNGKDIVLVDDVIFTGRTVRAALEAVFDLGRPKTVQLAVLVDRGLRELPFRPDYVGKNVPTRHTELVCVSLEEIDGEDIVTIME
ncbi:MAG: bifunctional pyr operon transcriptional regulator/uracil phosphoribosyltransferase PyrR [Clostridia bacterium]|nr:bifunctional pyr operon transcriptional regulator/uracil phosphoribosyltransferase PyrR [Clostridia bacterium]